jgi:hypothetical protein
VFSPATHTRLPAYQTPTVSDLQQKLREILRELSVGDNADRRQNIFTDRSLYGCSDWQRNDMKYTTHAILILCWLTLVAANPTYAQTVITGRVLDNDNNPVPYANIITGIYGSSSNESGHFEVKLPDLQAPAILKISCIGYQTKQITLQPGPKQIDLKAIRLDRKVTQLTEVVVRAKLATVEETLAKIKKNLPKNYNYEPFQRQEYVVVRKYDRSNRLVQKAEVVMDQHLSRGYSKNPKYAINFIQKRTTGDGARVDDEEFYWFDFLCLAKNDINLVSYPYSKPKAYRYSIDKTVYEHDGVDALAINYEKIDPSNRLDGGWLTAQRIFGKIYVNEHDHAILRIEENIILKEFDPTEKSSKEQLFKPHIQFRHLRSTANFRKFGDHYYLSHAAVECVNADKADFNGTVRSDLLVTAYLPFGKVCDPCNIEFSKAKSDPEFWKQQTIYLDEIGELEKQ